MRDQSCSTFFDDETVGVVAGLERVNVAIVKWRRLEILAYPMRYVRNFMV